MSPRGPSACAAHAAVNTKLSKIESLRERRRRENGFWPSDRGFFCLDDAERVRFLSAAHVKMRLPSLKGVIFPHSVMVILGVIPLALNEAFICLVMRALFLIINKNAF
jgi:hypothetical protein